MVSLRSFCVKARPFVIIFIQAYLVGSLKIINKPEFEVENKAIEFS